MRFDVPHPIPYQGSKRKLAATILSFVQPGQFRTLYEPFSGSASVTLAAATRELFQNYVITDVLHPLSAIWEQVISEPQCVAESYERLWNAQKENPENFFYDVRSAYNRDRDPAKLLFLIARCVKNAVRFSKCGDFNQSPDKRRRGTHPETMKREIIGAHQVLRGRASSYHSDYKEIFASVSQDDLLYLDPPYQGTSEGRDTRYISGVNREELLKEIQALNKRGVQFLLSYDGALGDKIYGEPLPDHLAHRFLIRVGRSSQATLNGNNHVTTESLYVSHDLATHMKAIQAFDIDFASQQASLPLGAVLSA